MCPARGSPGRGALRRDRARERAGRAAASSTIHTDNPDPFAFRHESDVNQAFASSVLEGSLPGRGRSSNAATGPSAIARSTQRWTV